MVFLLTLHANNVFGHLIFKYLASSLNLTNGTNFQLASTDVFGHCNHFETHSNVYDHKIMIEAYVSILEFVHFSFVDIKKQFRTRMKSF